ncbi:MAG TPA: hypothetical protein HPP66_04200 [Planctomycetes bacterium]|nr:hypothetical protein [Planctomycetota bacterium]
MALEFHIVIDLAVKVICVSILIFIFLLVLRNVCANKMILLGFANLKIYRIIIALSICSVVLFILIVSILSISTRREISLMIENLEDCTELKIVNSLMTLKGSVTEESTINDRRIIERLVSVMNKGGFTRMTSRGCIETKEYIDIYVFKNKREIVKFRIIGGYVLEIGEEPELRRYRSSSKKLLWEVRISLGVTIND